MATIDEAFAIATAQQRTGRLDLAEEIARRILVVEPDHADALHLLGVLAHQAGKHEEAAEHIACAIRLKGTAAEYHSNLGAVLKDRGMPDEAARCCRRALELDPGFAAAHYNLAGALHAQGRLDEAIACYRRALELQPADPAAHNNLGIALQEQGNQGEAVACYRRALELSPGDAKGWNNLGSALRCQGRLAEAAACCAEALRQRPRYARAAYNLGNALRDQRDLEGAAACFRRALEFEPGLAEARSNLAALVHYRPGVTLAELAATHADYDVHHAQPLRPVDPRHDNPPEPLRRLRVGLVSADLRRHPVGYFLIRAVENLDRQQCEIACYSDARSADDLTTRFQGAAALWRPTRGLPDEQVAGQVRADRVDILIDLAGHTEPNRLLVFARKAAPVQLTWAGYVGTTGLSAMDGLVADRYHVPPEAEVHYRERILRMPEGYVCYDPPPYAPPVSPLPALRQGFVTFGSFNAPAKINGRVIEVWAEILQRVSRARLVLKHLGMSDSAVARAVLAEFAGRGIDPGRLECLGWSPHERLLAEYQRVDVALDPFPYSGGLTTCEALWMGVPVITCPGETFASRHSLSHLSTVGLLETIAGSLDDYAGAAVRLARDLPCLAALRQDLRRRVAESPLCDGKRFAENLAGLLRGAWRDWCGRRAAELESPDAESR